MSEQESAGSPPADRYEEEDSPAASSGAGEASSVATAAPAEKNEPLFSVAERAQFDADDVQAGGVIGKMLAIFFLYTVIAMSIVAWWTFRTID